MNTLLCEECKKRPATVHLTRVVNNHKAERHLCEVCARESGEIDFMLEPKFSIHHLLAGLMDQEGFGGGPARTTREVPRCPGCGRTYHEFASTGRLGCGRCYEQFSDQLEPLLRRLHGGTEHPGRVPTRSSGRIKTRRQIVNLRAQLAEYVRQEQYEQAAELRDRIRTLEGELRQKAGE